MATALTNTTPNAMVSSNPALTGFRLGEDDLFDASDSDSGQSAHSERSLSPSTTQVRKSKTKKKKERKEVGALTDELGALLGEAFQKPNGGSEDAGAASGT